MLHGEKSVVLDLAINLLVLSIKENKKKLLEISITGAIGLYNNEIKYSTLKL